jgi:hypothetical protein
MGRTPFITILTSVFAASSASVAQSPGPAKKGMIAVSKRLQLIAKAPEHKIGLDSDVEISLTLRNTTSMVLAFTETSPDLDFSFVVKTNDNRDVLLTDLGKRLATEPRRGDRRVTRELKPGENIAYAVSLGTLYRFEGPGRYVIRASRAVAIQAPGTALERAISNPITVILE